VSTDPATAPDAVLAHPFPVPGPVLRLAFGELARAAGGTPVQAGAVGDPEGLPRPWDPPTCRGPLRAEVWAWLDAVVTWLNRTYTWDVAGTIPSCWPQHPHLVHELAVLADQRRRAGAALTSDALEEWHRYTLPAFTDRLRARTKDHCEQGHQPWPTRGRHARYLTETPHRDTVFARDVAATTTMAGVGGGPAGRRPRLAVVDLVTGAITDPTP
jgi:hypothetical protein